MKNNCWVVVNSGDRSCSACGADFNGHFSDTVEVYNHYKRYETFTERVFYSLRMAKSECNHKNKELPVGADSYVVCGCHCDEFDF